MCVEGATNDDRWVGGYMIDLPISRFDGTIDVRWYDDQAKAIGETHQTLDQPRFVLQVPGWVDAKKVASFRVRARDDDAARNAEGQFQVRPNAPPKPLEVAKAAPIAASTPPAATIAPSSDEHNRKLKQAAEAVDTASASKKQDDAKSAETAATDEQKVKPAH